MVFRNRRIKDIFNLMKILPRSYKYFKDINWILFYIPQNQNVL